jgi:hypothetical protein
LKIIRRAVRASHKGGFRICEFNVLGNHLHLVTEASGKEAPRVAEARPADGEGDRVATHRRLEEARLAAL